MGAEVGQLILQGAFFPAVVLMGVEAVHVGGAESPHTGSNCSIYYPIVCIPDPPPDLDCGEVGFRNFELLAGGPHRFDGNKDGVGCEN